MKKELDNLYLKNDFNCAESTLRAANQDYNLNLKVEDLKLSAGFGGGMGCGLTCGLLAADIMVLSMVFVKSRAHEDPAFKTLCKDFVSEFRKQFGGTTCLYIKKKCANPSTRCLSAVEANYTLLQQFIKSHK